MDRLKRFTSKYPDSTPVYHKYYLNGYHYEQGEHIDKLGQIEDIEEELGISLITLYHASKDGIYAKDFTNANVNYCHININFEHKALIYFYDYFNTNAYDSGYVEFEFKDYGVTWALTKEELEDAHHCERV